MEHIDDDLSCTSCTPLKRAMRNGAQTILSQLVSDVQHAERMNIRFSCSSSEYAVPTRLAGVPRELYKLCGESSWAAVYYAIVPAISEKVYIVTLGIIGVDLG